MKRHLLLVCPLALIAVLSSGCPVEPPTQPAIAANSRIAMGGAPTFASFQLANPGGVTNLTSNDLGRDFSGLGDPTSAAYVSVDGSGELTYFDSTGAATFTIAGPIAEALISRDGSNLLVGRLTPTFVVEVYDTATHQLIRSYDDASLSITYGIDLSADGRWVAYRDTTGAIRLGDSETPGPSTVVITPPYGCYRPRILSTLRVVGYCPVNGRGALVSSDINLDIRELFFTSDPATVPTSNNLVADIGTGKVIYENENGSSRTVFVLEDRLGATPVAAHVFDAATTSGIGGRALPVTAGS